jgi:Ca2+-binding EF-hand superfamily protein
MDTNSDHRISYAEFRRGHDDLGLHVSSDDDLKRIFAAIDSNHGGMILFNEFCLFMAKLLYHRNNQ